jgi:hypothetical protein
MKRIFFLCLLGGHLLTAQERYLISPTNEVIPIAKHASAAQQIRELSQRTGSCDRFILGYPPELYPLGFIWYVDQKEVLGQWYVAPASGAIDTVFWVGASTVGAEDSLVILRIFNSNIGPHHGPGIRPGPYNPPCQNWGYWVNTLDADQGIAAFIDDATDTTWISTYNGPVPSTPPFGSEIWGLGIGYGVIERDGLNYVALADIGLLPVTAGQTFFITLRPKGSGWHLDRNTTGFYGWDQRVSTDDENYPSRNWKFYEHDSETSSSCHLEISKKGWMARGGFYDGDSLDVAALSIWFSMTPKSNYPPSITSIPGGDAHITLSTDPQVIRYEIRDCNPAYPESAIVSSARIEWSKASTEALDFVHQADISMTNTLGDIWEGAIPGQPPGTFVRYRISATDIGGMSSVGFPHQYKVATLVNPYYYLDTSYAITWRDISSSGTPIDTSRFFYSTLAKNRTTFPKDDGTAGPFDIGGTMRFFNWTVRYAWIGVNGALALSPSPTDTIDVNADGAFTSEWDVPHRRTDSASGVPMPLNFIAPLWADFTLGDTSAAYGRILTGNGGDTCQFIVEWDSLGDFPGFPGGAVSDIGRFRAIVNRCAGTIEFQYNSTGTHGQDSSGLVCLQQSSSYLGNQVPPYFFVNKSGGPRGTKPRGNWAMKFYPGAPFDAQPGWNIVSISTVPPDYHKGNCYPTALSDAFFYRGSYAAERILANGKGYWLKFGEPTYAGVPGFPLSQACDTVQKGWNMIGGFSTSVVNTSDIIQNPPGIVASSYYMYGATGYAAITQLEPGWGYWVKVTENGTLCVEGGVKISKAEEPFTPQAMNTFSLRDSRGRAQALYLAEEGLLKQPLGMYELPPAAPDFDARFSSGRMVELVPARAREGCEYPLQIQTDAFPVTISWNIAHPPDGLTMGLSAGGKFLCSMEGTGSAKIDKNALTGLAITLASGKGVPREYALLQNYPNPFNPVTVIRYELPLVSGVSLTVFNLLGQVVAVLRDGVESAGYKSVEWDATRVASGVYFYRLEATSTQDPAKTFGEIRRMVLIK